MTRRAGVFLLLALALSSIGASAASADRAVQPALYYLGRADPRLCPSPMCGGLWVRAVNGGEVRCADPAGRECYVASTTIGELELPETKRARLAQLFSDGRALVAGYIERGRVEGFPELAVLGVSQVWTPVAMTSRGQGSFYFVRDNGARCAAAPCFSTSATLLNGERELRVSSVDLSHASASADVRRRTRSHIARPRGVIAVGRIERDPNAGPAGDGRTLVVTRLYFRASPP